MVSIAAAAVGRHQIQEEYPLVSTQAPEGFVPVTVAPPVPNLEFNILLPLDWTRHELPREEVDFENPTAFMPLAVFVHNPSYSIFSVAARPAYENGTLLDWLKYLAADQKWSVESLSPFETNAGTGASAVATQDNEGGKTRLRAVVLEDGKRVITVTAMTPVESWDGAAELFDFMLRSFSLLTPQGQTVPLAPADA